jgi:hypothetical protein
MACRRIGQDMLVFSAERAARQSTLDKLLELIDWTPIEHHLWDISCAAKGEPAWPPLALFKAMLIAVWHDLGLNHLQAPTSRTPRSRRDSRQQVVGPGERLTARDGGNRRLATARPSASDCPPTSAMSLPVSGPWRRWLPGASHF